MMEAVAMLPWWAGVALALISFLVLSHFAQPSVAPDHPQDVEQLSKVARDTLLHTLASLGRIVLPLIFLFGAGMSLLSRHRRASLHDKAKSDGLAAVAGMSWKDFERLGHELFRRQGYAVLESRAGADGGVDLRLQKAGQVTLVQCKHWKSDVGVKVVRELHGIVAASKAAGGIVVSSSGFTAEARRFAESAGVRLIDGKTLESEVGYTAQDAQPATPAALSPGERISEPQMCPACHGEMVVRTAKKGAAAGRRFLGCKRYPECRGTRRPQSTIAW